MPAVIGDKLADLVTPPLAGWDTASVPAEDRTVIWVLDNHDHTRAIGAAKSSSNGKGLRVRFERNSALTRKQFFEVFGNCGIHVIEFVQPSGIITRDEEDRELIIEAEIVEWSRISAPPANEPGTSVTNRR